MCLPLVAEPGGGGAGSSGLARWQGDDGTVSRVLQAQLAHVGEDGLHLQLCHQLLQGRGEVILAVYRHI